jgi:hypothetical protein
MTVNERAVLISCVNKIKAQKYGSTDSDPNLSIV